MQAEGAFERIGGDIVRRDENVITVANRNSDVKCPKCKSLMRKDKYPFTPAPTNQPSGELIGIPLGQAYCETCQEEFPWCVES